MTISLSSATPPAMDSAAALKTIEAAQGDVKHPLWSMTPEAQRELYLKAYPGARPSFGSTLRLESSPSTPTLATPEASVSPQPAPWPPPQEEVRRKDPWTNQREADAETERIRQEMKTAGTPNPALFYETPRGLQEARPPEPLDVTDVPSEDHEAATVFHEATGAQNFVTRGWLEHAAGHTPLDADAAWEVLHKQHGQSAGPLVYDAREAFHHKDFPAAIKRFIERYQLENDPSTLAALAEWHRARTGK